MNKIRYILLLPLLIFTLLTAPDAASTPSAELLSTDVFVFDQALLMGQGITSNGEHYYTSGAIAFLRLAVLGRFSFEGMKPEKSRVNLLPKGYDHIGGISVYKDKIYAAVEGKPDGNEYISSIQVFYCNSLKSTGEIYELPKDAYFDGVSWCAVNPETGFLYASTWCEAKTLYEYDTQNEMKLIREIPLTGLGELNRIQGGDFYNGKLYLSEDTKYNGNFKRIIGIDINSGEVYVVAERNVGREKVEAEGIACYPAADGSLLHALDYDKQIGVFVRHYKLK